MLPWIERELPGRCANGLLPAPQTYFGGSVRVTDLNKGLFELFFLFNLLSFYEWCEKGCFYSWFLWSSFVLSPSLGKWQRCSLKLGVYSLKVWITHLLWFIVIVFRGCILYPRRSVMFVCVCTVKASWLLLARELWHVTFVIKLPGKIFRTIYLDSCVNTLVFFHSNWLCWAIIAMLQMNLDCFMVILDSLM